MERLILGIDPGPITSGYCLWDTKKQNIVQAFDAMENRRIDAIPFVEMEDSDKYLTIAYIVEDIEFRRGVNAGRTVFDTCKTIGRLQERFPPAFTHVYRKSAISNHFEGYKKLKERYPKGTKKNPGITYELTNHSWSAFALCIFYEDKCMGKV